MSRYQSYGVAGGETVTGDTWWYRSDWMRWSISPLSRRAGLQAVSRSGFPSTTRGSACEAVMCVEHNNNKAAQPIRLLRSPTAPLQSAGLCGSRCHLRGGPAWRTCQRFRPELRSCLGKEALSPQDYPSTPRRGRRPAGAFWPAKVGTLRSSGWKNRRPRPR